MNYRFFKSTYIKVVAEAQRLADFNDANHAKALALISETGCKNIWRSTEGHVVGFEFEENPCTKVWKKVRGYYMPKVSTTKGKKINDSAKSLRRKNINTILEGSLIGLPSADMCVFSGNKCYSTSCGFYDGVFYAKIPWPDFISADEIEKYKNKDESRTWIDSNLEHMSWDKPECLIEMKEWEFLRDLDK